MNLQRQCTLQRRLLDRHRCLDRCSSLDRSRQRSKVARASHTRRRKKEKRCTAGPVSRRAEGSRRTAACSGRSIRPCTEWRPCSTPCPSRHRTESSCKRGSPRSGRHSSPGWLPSWRCRRRCRRSCTSPVARHMRSTSETACRTWGRSRPYCTGRFRAASEAGRWDTRPSRCSSRPLRSSRPSKREA
jgi:hypothetical protein